MVRFLLWCDMEFVGVFFFFFLMVCVLFLQMSVVTLDLGPPMLSITHVSFGLLSCWYVAWFWWINFGLFLSWFFVRYCSTC